MNPALCSAIKSSLMQRHLGSFFLGLSNCKVGEWMHFATLPAANWHLLSSAGTLPPHSLQTLQHDQRKKNYDQLYHPCSHPFADRWSPPSTTKFASSCLPSKRGQETQTITELRLWPRNGILSAEMIIQTLQGSVDAFGQWTVQVVLLDQEKVISASCHVNPIAKPQSVKWTQVRKYK